MGLNLVGNYAMRPAVNGRSRLEVEDGPPDRRSSPDQQEEELPTVRASALSHDAKQRCQNKRRDNSRVPNSQPSHAKRIEFLEAFRGFHAHIMTRPEREVLTSPFEGMSVSLAAL